jgi:hypothetical protein
VRTASSGGGGDAGGEGAQDQEAALVDPLGVLDDEEEALVLVREGDEVGGDGGVELVVGLERGAVLAVWTCPGEHVAKARTKLEQEELGVAGGGVEAHAGLGAGAGREAMQAAQQLVEGAAEGGEGGDLAGLAAAGEHERGGAAGQRGGVAAGLGERGDEGGGAKQAAGGEGGGARRWFAAARAFAGADGAGDGVEEGADEAGLAAAGAADEGDEAAEATQGAGPVVAQLGELGFAADERGLVIEGAGLVVAAEGGRVAEAVDAGEVGGEAGGGLVAVVGVLGEQASDDRGEGGRAGRGELAQVGRGDDGVHAQELAEVVGEEGRAAAGTLEEHGAEGIEVGAAVERALQHAGLLGGAVDERAGDLAGLVAGAGVGGEAEVDELEAAGVDDEDVVGLEVAVDHAAAVDLGEGAGEGVGDADELGLGHGSAGGEDGGEGLAGDEVHDEVGLLVVLADGEDLDEAGVAQGGERGGLAAKLQGLGLAVGADGAAQELDGDDAITDPAAMDDAARPLADLLLDLDARNLDHRWPGLRRSRCHDQANGVLPAGAAARGHPEDHARAARGRGAWTGRRAFV